DVYAHRQLSAECRTRSAEYRLTIRDRMELKKGFVSNENLKKRTKRFALDVINLVEDLPPGKVSDVLGRQLLRSGTSVGANYRAACRGKSTADVISKLGNVEEEADETLYWLELLLEAKVVPAARLD